MDGNLNPDPGEKPGSIKEMDYDNQTNRRPRQESDNKENPDPKLARRHEVSRNLEPQSPATNSITNRQDEITKHVVLISLTDGFERASFNNPMKLTDALNKSVFQKYIIEDSLRVLGIGRAIRFEVNSLTKLPSLNQITKLGEWNILYKQPTSNKNISSSYSTIYPVETELEPKEIIDKIRLLLGHDNEIVEVIRINKVTFKGPLPKRVAIGHRSYIVQQYTFPIPKCFRCLIYGHGIMTRKNKKEM